MTTLRYYCQLPRSRFKLKFSLSERKETEETPFCSISFLQVYSRDVMPLCGLQAVVKFRGKTHQLYPKGLSGTASALAGAALYREAGCFSRTSHAPKLSKLSCLSSSMLLELSATTHNRFNGVAHRTSYVGKVPWYFSLVPQNFLT